MVETVERPMSLSMLRHHHLKEAGSSVVAFGAGALIFWAIGFGTDASPSVLQMLVTIALPVILLKEYVIYVSEVKRRGFVEVPSMGMRGGLTSQRQFN